MKLLPFILLAVVIYLLIRLQNERAKTDFQIAAVKDSIPDPAEITPTIITQVVSSDVVAPGDYLESYQSSKL